MHWKGPWSDYDLSETGALPFHVPLHQSISYHLWCCTAWCPPPAAPLLGHIWAGRQGAYLALPQRQQEAPGIPAELQLLQELALGRGPCCVGVVPPVEVGDCAPWDVTSTAEHRDALLGRASLPFCVLFYANCCIRWLPPWAVPCAWGCPSPVTPEWICNCWSWGQEADTLARFGALQIT